MLFGLAIMQEDALWLNRFNCLVRRRSQEHLVEQLGRWLFVAGLNLHEPMGMIDGTLGV